ncbi:hypothetical protein HQ544_05445 [Candidatus Falkowbacteria bacterium]|nr:hypothetical protein [Candidatus Falkowbacteria bacterium]
MLDLRREREGFFSRITDNRIARIVGGIVVVLALIVLAIAGFGFLTSLGLVILLGIIIVFGSLGRLATSIVVAGLFAILHGDIVGLLGTWDSLERTAVFLVRLHALGFFKVTLLVFLLAHTLSFLTGSIRIFNVSSKSTLKAEEKSEDE